MREALILAGAAAIEVGGDALIRWGLRGGQNLGFILGAVFLFGYGLLVNVPKWDFGRLLGVYIALFFVVSQAASYVFFHEKIKMPMLAGGALIIAGGLVMTFWNEDEPVQIPAVTENIETAISGSK